MLNTHIHTHTLTQSSPKIQTFNIFWIEKYFLVARFEHSARFNIHFSNGNVNEMNVYCTLTVTEGEII